MVYPLIDPRSVAQSRLGPTRDERLADSRTAAGVKGVVIAVYPVGHAENRLGQTLVDVQPTVELPLLHRVPVCLSHAHQETDIAVASSARRQPYTPKVRNRMEGSARDLRPGTFVWVQFLNGDLSEPVVVATMKYNAQGDRGFPLERQIVDRVTDAGGVETAEVHPLDAELASYPRSVDLYNGCRREVTNDGSYAAHTSTDRTPVFPGHNNVPASPAPRGNYIVSSRGARIGNHLFVSGRHPSHGDEESVGRQGRLTIDADQGSIRDETRGSKIGNLIHRLKSTVGRFFLSTRGSGDARVYLEDDERNYLALTPKNGRAELHGDQMAVLDAIAVRLGHSGADHSAVTWEELKALLGDCFTIYDQHTHPYLAGSTPSNTSPPIQKIAPTWNGRATECQSQVVKLDLTDAAAPTFQTDPDGDA